MGTAPLFTSGATFAVAVAAAPLLFFVTSDKRKRRCFLAEKAAAIQRCFLRKFSAATANKLLPRLFQFHFYMLRLKSLLSACFHSALVTSLFQVNRHTRPL